MELNNARFRYAKANAPKTDVGMNFKDMLFTNLNIDGRDFVVSGDTIALSINCMSFNEQSGLRIDKFRSYFSICNKSMNFNKLRIVSDCTSLSLSDLKLSYDGYDKLSYFTQNVIINANFTGTSVNSDFIAYFSPALLGYNIQLGINGAVTGRINELRGRKLDITHGNNTFISADISLSGLPDINETLINADFKSLSTS